MLRCDLFTCSFDVSIVPEFSILNHNLARNLRYPQGFEDPKCECGGNA